MVSDVVDARSLVIRMRTMLKRKIKLICNLSTQWDGVGICVHKRLETGWVDRAGPQCLQVWSARGPCQSTVGTDCSSLLPPYPGSYQQDQDHGALVDVVSVHPRSFAKPAPRKPQRRGKGGGHPGPVKWHGEGQCLARAGLGPEARLWVPQFQPWKKVKIPTQCLSYSICRMDR